MRRAWRIVAIVALVCGCANDPETSSDAGSGEADAAQDAAGSEVASVDAGADGGEPDLRMADVSVDVGTDANPFVPAPVPDPPVEEPTDEARARGFQLYYRERVDRLLTAYNRFHLTGGVTFGKTIRGIRVAKSGSEYEVLAGPSDNNQIGTSVWNVYHAYKAFGTRELELTLIRMLNGLVFYEQVTGHPGMTSREAYPGWTRTVDGVGGTMELTRFGAPVTPPTTFNPELEAEMISTFWDGVEFTYRENPEDFLFQLFPAVEPVRYAKSISFVELPKLIRNSECCSSLMRTPGDKPWAGAYWGNHNSRDNFPDIGLGFLAARLAAEDPQASEDVRDAASSAVASGERIGDLILDNETSLMTVSDVGDYDTDWEVSGTVRPHGEPENQDLGSLGACTMAFLAQAISSEELSVDGDPIPLPGSTDKEFFSAPAIQNNIDCPLAENPTCSELGDGYCGRKWGEFPGITFQGQPILEYFEANPAFAKALTESWQNDFDDVTEASMAVYHFAVSNGDPELIAEARETVFHITELQIALADFAYPDNEERRRYQKYRAALYRAEADLPVDAEHWSDFQRAEARASALEGWLSIGDTSPAALLTDAEIEVEIAEDLENEKLGHVVERYENAYPDGPPVRRTTNGYEAKGTPEVEWPWREVEVPRHRYIGWHRLMEGVVLCNEAPQWLSCDWAKLGCERPDIDGDGDVDSDDVLAVEAAVGDAVGTTCDENNSWCGGGDLDRDGAADGRDRAFAEAAEGCWY